MPAEAPNLDEWFPQTDGLPRPDWPAINTWIRGSVSGGQTIEVADQITLHWLTRLAAALGTTFTVEASKHFLLLSEAPAWKREKTFDFLEKAHSYVLRGLGDGAQKCGPSQQVFLYLPSVDDIETYCASFDSDGQFVEEANNFFPRNAIPEPCVDFFPMMAANVTDHLLGYLPLPTWLHMAARQMFTVQLIGGRFAILTEELFTEHERYWNAETIQGFWSGKSFAIEESANIVRSLPDVLIDIILRELRPGPDSISRFLTQATWADAGEAAARRHLGVSLSEVVSVFLGDGDWSPKPATWRTESNDSSAEPTITLPDR